MFVDVRGEREHAKSSTPDVEDLAFVAPDDDDEVKWESQHVPLERSARGDATELKVTLDAAAV